MPLTIDFETKSTVDLSKKGSYEYAIHLTTTALCMAYSFDKGPVELWTPNLPFPKEVIDYVSRGRIVCAHNAVFEFNIWNYCLRRTLDIPELKLEQVECTMAKCYYHSLPGSLEEAAIVLNLRATKDMAGKRVMLQLSSPRKIVNDIPIFYEESDYPEKFQILYDYCKKDVEVEREIHYTLKSLPEIEKRFWRLDYQINKTGVSVDLKSAKLASKIVEEEKKNLDYKIHSITNGEVGACTEVAKITKWIKAQGREIETLGKANLKDLIKNETDDQIKEVMLLRQMASKSSNAKIESIMECVGSDGRIREMFQFYGSHTGRFAGRKVQLQNFPRPNLKKEDINLIFKAINQFQTTDAIELIDSMYAPPLQVLSDCLRGFLVPKKDHKFIVVDWASIEARVLAWLAGQEDVLETFRDKQDLYIAAASKIYNKDKSLITKDERFIGKVSSLSCQYQGGVKAFQLMAKAYGLEISEEKADDIKTAWREANQNIVKYWYALNDAAVKTINLKRSHSIGSNNTKVIFAYEDSFLKCKLPSGRDITYPFPRLEKESFSNGEDIYFKNGMRYMGRNSVTKKWEEIKTYGGKLVENCLGSNTRVITSRGLKKIIDITSCDLIFDGNNFVSHGGVIFKGVKGALKWRGLFITEDHLILDGEQWKPSIAVVESASVECLKLARNLVIGKLWNLLVVTMRTYCVSVYVVLKNMLAVDVFLENAHRGVQSVAQKVEKENTPHILKIPNCLLYGRIGTQGLFQDATIKAIRLTKTTEAEGLRSMPHGKRIENLFSNMSLPLKITILCQVIWIGLITMRGIIQEISESFLGQLTLVIEEQILILNTKTKNTRTQNFTKPSALIGKVQILFTIILAWAEKPKKLNKCMTEVYDIANCGPLNRFMVLTNSGPIIVHNCVQALSRDILRDALLSLNDKGYKTVMHCHDEIICETPIGTGSVEEVKEIMCSSSPWAIGLPLGAEGWDGLRYGKE